MHKFSKKLLMETYVLSIKVYIVKKGTKNKQTGTYWLQIMFTKMNLLQTYHMTFIISLTSTRPTQTLHVTLR